MKILQATLIVDSNSPISKVNEASPLRWLEILQLCSPDPKQGGFSWNRYVDNSIPATY